MSFLMQPPFQAYKRDVSLSNTMVRSTNDASSEQPASRACQRHRLQLHNFCRWYAALSPFPIRDHSYFFTLVKLSCSSLSDSQGGNAREMFAGWKKGKRNRCPGYTTASRLMNTKPLCLSHLEIDRWKLLWNISFSLTFLFIFQLISPLQEYFFRTSPTPTPITFLMVHLTLRAEPNLLSDTKWSSERMVRCAAERLRGPSLSLHSGGSRGGARGETCPSPYLRVWMIAPLLISRSGSGFVIYHPNYYNTSPMLSLRGREA